MFDPCPGPRLFGLPPGTDFPMALVDGLIARTRDSPPEAMARVTLYLNTARMQRRVRALFDERGARFLPKLRLVTDLGRDPLAGLPPAIPPLRRRLELARLVAGLVDQQPDFAAGTAVYDLADSLARLMDEMQGEAVQPEAFEQLDLSENHAEHWERSLQFLRIIGRYFAENAAPDAEARQRLMVDALAERWRSAPPTDPIIVAGSTGSRGATLAFMQAVAALPEGAVVLPGVDFDMDETAWNGLSAGTMPGEDHPQYRFLRLTDALDVSPLDIRRWPIGEAPDPARNRLISLALRPAPVTDQWMSEGKNLGHLEPATQHWTLIEAPSPRDEAQAIAACMRHAAETRVTVALVTPDRMLTRRVAAALGRWGIVPDDSAGEPLAQTAPGRFLRHVAGLFGRRLSTEALLILLKHPLTATGAGDRGNHLRFTRDLELKLRRYGPAFPTAADLTAWARAKGEPERIAWAEWLGQALDGVETTGAAPLAAYIETHLGLCECLAAGPGGHAEQSELWRTEAGRVAQSAMEGLRRESSYGGTVHTHEYSSLISAILRDGSVRRSEVVHPGVMVWGTLEARVQGAELVILAGLNEGVWPERPAPDPWLSRQMRQKAGLLLPERRIGLSAHDFQQAAAAPRVILSRAIRNAEAETVPSRWLARLTNLMKGLPDQGGQMALQAMQDRGQVWLDHARAIDAPEPAHCTGRALRPAPRPPVSARPTSLPVTAIQTLIRDPYQIYAERILRLRRLDPLRAEPDARVRGKVLHKIVEDFIRDRPEDETDAAAQSRLLHVAEIRLSEDIPWPSAQRMWLAKLARIAGGFVASERQRQALGTPILLEKSGSVPLKSVDFTLTAKPDRIDLLSDGRVHIYDYKTGAPPTKKEQTYFNKQLVLEAAMAERGAFQVVGPVNVAGTTYIQLGGDGDEKPGLDDEGITTEAWAELHRLISAYARHSTGYTARRAVFETRRRGDFDHLARFGEWLMGDTPAPEDVG
ncbi:MAG: double-strand break repair protein AddB [Albidovulum sp.]